jgi:iron-sulfur cluster repair protein YtfE (RIC family)
MKDILKIMDQDHEEIAKLFTQFLLKVNSQSEKGVSIFSLLKQNLNRHIQWEEKILFPLLEEQTGPPGLDTTFVLKNEHNQIITMFIDKIEALLTQKKYSEISTLAVGLEEMLTMHRKYENDIFYPWFDDKLEEIERVRLLKLLKSRRNK